jgi:hypothetical protein
MPGSNFFQDPPGHFLQLAKACEVILKIVVEDLRVLRPQLRAQDHIAQFDGVWQQRILLEFVKRGFRIVVIHKFPQQKMRTFVLYSRRKSQASLAESGIGEEN